MQFREALIVSGGFMTQQAAVFLTNIILARGLGPDGFGELAILKNLSTIVLLITPLGLDLALLKYASLYRDKPGEAGTIGATLRATVMVINILIVAITYLYLGGVLQKFYPGIEDFPYHSTITLLGICFAADLQISAAIYRVRGKITAYTYVVYYAQPVLRMLLAFALIQAGFGVEAIIWSITLTSLATFLAILWLEKTASIKYVAIPPLELWKRIAKVLSESIWMALSLAVYQMMRFADVLLLGALASVAATGQYTAASSVAQIISIYPLALSQTLGPRIASLYESQNMGEIAAELQRYVRLASILGGYLFAGVAVFGVDLDLLFGPEFSFSRTLTMLLAAGWYLSALLAPFGYVLSMTGRHRDELAILLLGAVVLLVCLFSLIPLYSEVGAALSILISFALVNAVRCIYVLRIIGRNPLLPSHLLPPFLFLSAALICQAVGGYLGGRSFFILVLECLFYTLCAAAVYIGVFATEAEKQKVLSKIWMRGQ